MPWLDTGIESGISRLQICPGWIQVSNLEISSCRCALAGYRYRIYNQSLTDVPWLDTSVESGNCRLQICPGWTQVPNLEFVVYRYALDGYRNRISKLTDMPWLDAGIESGTSKGCLQTCPGWIQVSNLQTIIHRRALVLYPKIFPPIFIKNCQSQGHKIHQGLCSSTVS